MQTKNQTHTFKNTIFLIILLFSKVQTINAQAYTGTNTHFKYSIFVKDKSEFLLTIVSKKENKMLFKSDIKFPEIEGKKVELEHAVCLNDTFLLFTSVLNKKNEKYSAYVYKIYPDGKLNPTSTKIDEILNSTKNNTGYFVFELSADSSSILAYHAHDENIQGEIKGKIFYKTLDKNLKVITTNEIDMPTSFEYCSAIRHKLIGNQNLLYIEKNYTKVEGEKDIIIKYNVCLYNSKDKKLYKASIMANEKYILDIKIEMSDNEQLFCSGIYGIDKSFGGSWNEIRCLKGAFYYLLNKNNLSENSHNSKDIQATLANDKLYRFHLTSSYVSNEKVNVTCQFQNTLLTSFISDDTKTYEKVYGEYIYTTFDLKDKTNVLVKMSEK